MAINLSFALTTLNKAGVDINADFHTLNSCEVEVLINLADIAGYRKPKNASGSRARMFFQALQRKYRAREK